MGNNCCTSNPIKNPLNVSDLVILLNEDENFFKEKQRYLKSEKTIKNYSKIARQFHFFKLEVINKGNLFEYKDIEKFVEDFRGIIYKHYDNDPTLLNYWEVFKEEMKKWRERFDMKFNSIKNA